MTKEPNAPNEQTATESASKLQIDRLSDFRFHAAYLVYSEAWEKTSSQEVKLKLNRIIEALSSGSLDYDSFYREISQYRGALYPEHYGGKRPFIETQSKRDWRKRDERDRRNARHGR
jgi:hypothetical protein